jgi:hypothetical protein
MCSQDWGGGEEGGSGQVKNVGVVEAFLFWRLKREVGGGGD